MVEWSTHKIDPVVMARYLAKVRKAIPAGHHRRQLAVLGLGAQGHRRRGGLRRGAHLPVPRHLLQPPLWDWRQKARHRPARAGHGGASITEAKRQFGQARAGLDKLGLAGMPMIIGETGWTAVDTAGGPNLAFRAHPVNQKMYFDALQAWAAEGRRGNGPQAVFFFQAFDEPWKQGDDGWGLFNTNRQARYTVQGLGTCGVTWTCEPAPTPPPTP
jgi:hypothetical protein